jgi:kumamolisin
MRKLTPVWATASIAACVLLTVLLWTGSSRSARAGASTPASLHFVGRAPANERVAFTLSLRLPGSRRLTASLNAIEDPGSPHFRRLIAPAAFGERFGISSTALHRLERTLARDGVRVIGSYPQRTDLRVSATVAVVQRLFSVALGVWRSARERGYRAPLGTPPAGYLAPLGTPHVPPPLQAAVSGVIGLDTRPQWTAQDVPAGGLTPTSAADAYDITALHAAGFDGQGETIAVVSFSAYSPSDPAGFARAYSIAGPSPQVIGVDGGTADTSGAGEANLDIDVIRSIAPDAQILFYEVPQTSSAYSDVINRIVADHRASIISSSWGECEPGLDPGEHASDAAALSAAVAAGDSMFVASGDSGAYDCQQSNFDDLHLSVDWPAASPDAIAVGGTRLYLGPGDSYAGETAWEDQLSDAGGGGGFSTEDPRPVWQRGPGVITRLSNGHRQLPDVSADADPGTPWSLYVYGGLQQAGGTSAAAPFWAASMALIAQYAAAHGVTKLGFVDPILYTLAASRQPFPPFHDVVRGGNRYYQATPGWDPATGLGSPDVYNLARDIVAYLHAPG